MENPLGSLRRLASLTKELAIIETHAVSIPGYEHLELCEFYSANQLNADVSNWWGPNLKALEGMCRAAGFSRVAVAGGGVEPPRVSKVGNALRELGLLPPLPPKVAQYFRVAVHAWK